MAGEPYWLTLEDVLEIHDDQLDVSGGAPGIKDIGLVDSAVHAPQQLNHYYGVTNALELGVQLAFSIGKNHGFVDGNKRTAAVALLEFLAINGWRIDIPDYDSNYPTLGRWIETMITDDINQAQLCARLAPHMYEALDDIDDDALPYDDLPEDFEASGDLMDGETL